MKFARNTLTLLIKTICILIMAIVGLLWFLQTQSGINFVVKTTNLFIPGTIALSDYKLTKKNLKLINFSYSNPDYNLLNTKAIDLDIDIIKLYAERTIEVKTLESLITIQGITTNNTSFTANITELSKIFTNISGDLKANTYITNNLIRGNIDSSNLRILDKNSIYVAKNIKSKLNISLDFKDKIEILTNISSLVINNSVLKDTDIAINGTGPKHCINLSSKFDSYKLNISGIGSLKNNKWDADINDIKLISKLNEHSKKEELLKIDSGNITFIAKDDNFDAKLEIYGKNANYLIFNFNKSNNSIAGRINSRLTHINLLNRVLPTIYNASGIIEINGNIGGTTNNPYFTSIINAKDIKFGIPAIGINITPLNFSLKGDKLGKFVLDGIATINNDTENLKLKGEFYPFANDLKNNIKITGNNITLYDLSDVKAKFSPDLNLNYDISDNTLNVSGKTMIESADINLESKHFVSTHTTSDIVYINNKGKHISQFSSKFNVNPNIFIKIKKQSYIYGFNLKANVGGKLIITKKDDNLIADGKITIKKGKYSIANHKYKIYKGILAYPKGNLLVDPKLHIIMQKRHSKILTKSEKIAEGTNGIYVHGSLKHPKLDFYSDKNKNNSEIVNSLGFSGGANNKTLAEALNITGASVTDKLKKTFKLDEISLDSVNNPGSKLSDEDETVLVIGKKATEKLYLQYIKGLQESDFITPTNKLKMKYKLTDELNIGVETGSDGYGGDLSIVFEK